MQTIDGVIKIQIRGEKKKDEEETNTHVLLFTYILRLNLYKFVKVNQERTTKVPKIYIHL